MLPIFFSLSDELLSNWPTMMVWRHINVIFEVNLGQLHSFISMVVGNVSKPLIRACSPKWEIEL